MQTLKLPKPYSLKQKIIMESFFTDGLLELWVAAGTKSGKSLAAASNMIAAACTNHNHMYRWVAPIYPQAKIGYRYCDRMLPFHVKENNKSDPSIHIKHTNSIMHFKSGKFPEDLEGEAVNGYCLDECAKMNPQVYDSAKTTVTITRGPIIAFSTPKGKNWFFEKCMIAQDEMRWAEKNNVQPTRLFLNFATIENPAVTKEAIDDAKKQLPERLFRQYYLAEFVDDGSVFTNFRACVDPSLQQMDYQTTTQVWHHPLAKEKTVVIGADWAKHKDFTVFIAMEMSENLKKVVGFMRFQNLAYTDAVGELYRFAKKFKETSVVYHDKTGVGDALDDLLCEINLPFEGILFNNTSKSNMVNNLAISFEQSRIMIPPWSEMLRELDFFEVEVSDTGLMRYNAPSGQHDDIIMALCLALKAANEYSGESFEIKFLEDLKNEKESIESYYQDIMDEDSPFGE
jgi:hypothetical protein